jgi:NADPH:quinone reductase-like Zn-dependent oxidoreductase
MTGTPYLLRAVFGFRTPRNPVPGLDVAGTVIAVGDSVSRFQPGDEVCGIAKGSFAEYAGAKEKKLVAKPTRLTFDQAAAVPVSGLTAIQAVIDNGRAQPGEHVLVTGASGGVGTYAVQIAKALGAEVTGVSSGAKADMVRSIGADHVPDYTTDDFADGSKRFDLIIDIAGNSSLAKLRSTLTPSGTLVIVGGEEGGRWTGGIDRQLRALAMSPFVSQRLIMFASKETHVDMARLSKMIEAGSVTPVIDRTFPLEEVPDAVRHLESGSARGKIVISIGPPTDA